MIQRILIIIKKLENETQLSNPNSSTLIFSNISDPILFLLALDSGIGICIDLGPEPGPDPDPDRDLSFYEFLL